MVNPDDRELHTYDHTSYESLGTAGCRPCLRDKDPSINAKNTQTINKNQRNNKAAQIYLLQSWQTLTSLSTLRALVSFQEIRKHHIDYHKWSGRTLWQDWRHLWTTHGSSFPQGIPHDISVMWQGMLDRSSWWPRHHFRVRTVHGGQVLSLWQWWAVWKGKTKYCLTNSSILY